MRKFILMALAASVAVPTLAVPTMASAQSYREARESQRDVREARRDLRQAERHGDRRDVREARRDVRSASREARQDWRDYRRGHRNVYHRSAYRGPSGYRYRPVAVGHRFQPAYYGSRYWVNDYARYRLPAPRAGARWVRYNNDVVLVNVRNGRVLTVYNGFFW
ncbi:RcnB family protein [Novosphingobium mangrovi (ex Hu et al. 2023)]|uniref:RcnB family protein n=1 Tax=Novosphingobium mangrovi (ex Hu et al. 2023) TaxID=2930094 RepID=A0ABT0AHF3_9SPHN|nr:RcnB family protein [Novosphingobium mangrovi (ex Hu et al. 2023)]MCJ1962617.1 RcnB family protein [Novosphingobium mangrovi (ex Hu et al. 2023)]